MSNNENDIEKSFGNGYHEGYCEGYDKGYRDGSRYGGGKNERPHGEWMVHQNGLLLTSECNQCHCFVGTINMNFCPNCGADMREADNE